MKTNLLVLMSAAALSLAACKSEEPPKPAAPQTTTTTTTTTTAPAAPASDDKSHVAEPGGLPGIADALKGDTKAEEKKADAGRPMPPAAPTAAPAEGAKK